MMGEEEGVREGVGGGGGTLTRHREISKISTRRVLAGGY